MEVKIDPKEKKEEGLRKQWNGYKISTNSYWMAHTQALSLPANREEKRLPGQAPLLALSKCKPPP